MGGVVSFLFGGREGGTTKNYQRIGELDKQASQEGIPRPLVWGRVRPISGNVIHLSEPRFEMIEESRQEVGGGGKGGGGGGSETIITYKEHVYRTYAIRICEGPITNVIRCWRDDKLVYDARGTTWGDENNEAFTYNVRLYLGKFDQQPDSKLEVLWGAGNVPAYRGTAYVVFDDHDITDWEGNIPHYTFEVERINPKGYLTSEVYTWNTVTSEVYTWDTVSSMMYGIDPELLQATATGGGVVEGYLDSNVNLLYSTDEGVETSFVGTGSLLSGFHRTPVIPYTLWPKEDEWGYVGTGSLLGVYHQSDAQSFTAPNELGSVGTGSLLGVYHQSDAVQYTFWPDIEQEISSVKGGTVIGISHNTQ